MENKRSLLIPSLLGALTTFVVPLSLCAWVLLTDDGLLPDGTPDDVPRRAAAGILLLSPLLFGVVFLGMLGLLYVLRALRMFTKRAVFFSILLLVLIGGADFGYDGYQSFGIRDAILSFTWGSVSTLLSVGIGVMVSCLSYLRWYNNLLKSDALKGAS